MVGDSQEDFQVSAERVFIAEVEEAVLAVLAVREANTVTD
jgi:hypothetical protein